MTIKKEDMDALIAKANDIGKASINQLRNSAMDLSAFSFSLCDGKDIAATNSLNEEFFDGLKEGKDLGLEYNEIYNYKAASEV